VVQSEKMEWRIRFENEGVAVENGKK